MTNFSRFFLVLPLVGLLTGCATAVYQPPVSGPTTNVTLHANKLRKGGFMVTSEVDFFINSCNSKRAGYVDLTDKKNVKSLRVSAGRPIAIEAHYFYMNGSIDDEGLAYLSFVPREGTNYSVAFTLNWDKFKVDVHRVSRTGALVSVPALYGDDRVTDFMKKNSCGGTI